MRFLFITIGLLFIMVYWIKRITRTIKQKDSPFGGALVSEAIFQWIGFLIVFISLLL